MAEAQNGEEILSKVSIPWVGCTNVTDDSGFAQCKDPNVRLVLGEELYQMLHWTRVFDELVFAWLLRKQVGSLFGWCC